jgi:hypothetical protein
VTTDAPKYVPKGAPRDKLVPCSVSRGEWRCGGWGKYPDPKDPTKLLCYQHSLDGRRSIRKRTKQAHAEWAKGKAARDAQAAREARCVALLSNVPDEMLQSERFERALGIAFKTLNLIK